jgi:tRNA U34 2-thiouridine synthase MnmA/TrmU
MKNKSYFILSIILSVILVSSWAFFGVYAFNNKQQETKAIAKEKEIESIIKKSSSGICHDKNSKYYASTKNFESYSSIEECLNSGGRLPI